MQKIYTLKMNRVFISHQLVLLVSIFVVNFLPYRTTGLVCYTSDGPFQEPVTCGFNNTFCKRYANMGDGSRAPPSIRKSCAPKWEGECIQKLFPADGGCFWGTYENIKKIRNCSGWEANNTNYNGNTKYCFCNTDHCNIDGIEMGPALKCFLTRPRGTTQKYKVCSAENFYCYKSRTKSKGPAFITRGCIPRLHIDCARKVFGDGCFQNSEEKFREEYLPCIEFSDVDTSPDMKSALDIIETKICYCNQEDFCNDVSWSGSSKFRKFLHFLCILGVFGVLVCIVLCIIYKCCPRRPFHNNVEPLPHHLQNMGTIWERESSL